MVSSVEGRFAFITWVNNLFMFGVDVPIPSKPAFHIQIAMRTLKMATIKMFCQIRLFGEPLITDLALINTVFGLLVSQHI